MFGNRVKLFTLLGFEVYVDFSWLILAALITWTLAAGFFPTEFPGMEASTYWWMGLAGALGLFASIIVHELGHSLVARRYDIPMKGITLFIFGGVAEMTKEPPNAKSELLMAIAGPIVSIIVSGFFYSIHWAAMTAEWPLPLSALSLYLSSINLLFAAFNMVPAFPLDGGRVLRAILWGLKHDLAWATRISSALGSAFGILLIMLGLISLFAGNIIGGIWWSILGMFIRVASKTSYQQMLLRQILEGEPVRNFMSRHPIAVPSSATIRELVENYIYTHHHKFFPVIADGKLIGGITLNRVKEVPIEEWHWRHVGDFALPCDQDNTITPNTDTMEALSIMHRTGSSRLMVTEHDCLVGILALKDLMNFLAVKLELEGEKHLILPPHTHAPRHATRPAH
jgi:Zn-dependent protease/predicted transcriptional regulator